MSSGRRVLNSLPHSPLLCDRHISDADCRTQYHFFCFSSLRYPCLPDISAGEAVATRWTVSFSQPHPRVDPPLGHPYYTN